MPDMLDFYVAPQPPQEAFIQEAIALVDKYIDIMPIPFRKIWSSSDHEAVALDWIAQMYDAEVGSA